jgi:D,D-heptose 1,7-bisphosphate phosphatase
MLLYSRQLVILVGGRGTRLGQAAKDTPKPLMPITNDRVFLDYFLEMSVRQGFSDILLLAGHMGQQVLDRYAHTRIGEANISVLIEPQPMGTGGAFAFAREHLADTFIAANGDTLFDVNIRAIDVALHANRNLDAVIGLREVENAGRYGSVTIDPNGMISSFNEKVPDAEGAAGLINGGIYAMRRRVIDTLPTTPCSIETDIFPRLAEKGTLSGVQCEGYFLDIGLPETLNQARQELPRRKRPALFLDRDGVVNKDKGYVHNIEDWEWIPGVEDLIKKANDTGYGVFIVTNQSGIARGYYNEGTFHQLSFWIKEQLYKKGAFIDDIYHCPYHKDGVIEGLQTFSPICRKPNPAMILRALRQHNLDAENSFLIGDQETDLAAAVHAGIDAYLYSGGNIHDWAKTLPKAKNIFKSDQNS